MRTVVLVLLALLLAGCVPLDPLMAPLTELARPAPDLPVAVQVARVLTLGAGFSALCWLIYKIVRGWE